MKAFASLPRLHTRPHLQAWSEWESHTGLSLPEAPQNREFEHLFYMLEAAVAGLGVGLSPFIYVAMEAVVWWRQTVWHRPARHARLRQCGSPVYPVDAP